MAQIPSLKKLHYLVKLHELKSFSKAANACFVGQSTLSAGISDLESGLERRLVERNRHNMTFTPIGLELVQQAKEILRATHQLVETAEKAGQFFESSLRLGVIPTIAPYLLPRYLKQLSTHFPHLKLLIREDLTDNLLTLLREGQLDLLIMALPYPTDAITSLSLHTDPLRLIHHPQSRFMENSATDSVDHLPDNSILLLEDGHCLRKHTLESCRFFNHKQINPFTTNSLNSIVQMVQYDLGVSFIPDMAIQADLLKESGISVHQGVLNEGMEREIGLAWRETSPFREEFAKLGERLRDCCKTRVSNPR